MNYYLRRKYCFLSRSHFSFLILAVKRTDCAGSRYNCNSGIYIQKFLIQLVRAFSSPSNYSPINIIDSINCTLLGIFKTVIETFIHPKEKGKKERNFQRKKKWALCLVIEQFCYQKSLAMGYKLGEHYEQYSELWILWKFSQRRSLRKTKRISSVWQKNVHVKTSLLFFWIVLVCVFCEGMVWYTYNTGLLYRK